MCVYYLIQENFYPRLKSIDFSIINKSLIFNYLVDISIIIFPRICVHQYAPKRFTRQHIL